METIKILTNKGKGTAHHPTELFIDWNGVSDATLHIMARGFILHVVQSSFRHSKEPIPAEMYLLATDMVHEEIYIPREYVPSVKKSPFEIMLEGMGQEEMLELLRKLQSE